MQSRRNVQLVLCLLLGALLGQLVGMPSATASPSATTVANDSCVPSTSATACTFVRFAHSPDLTSQHADVFRLYWAFFDREPDATGAEYWAQETDRCVDLHSVTWTFGHSDEFVHTYGPMTDVQFVELVYGNVLDRQPDAEGATYWASELATGKLDRSGVMLNFSLSDEFRIRRPLPSDSRPATSCTPPSSTDSASRYYANCTAARDAGAAPILRGEPGYRAGLDGDDDGIACEN